jgi:hypothetical protein
MHNVPGPTPKKQEPESKRVDKLIERLTLIRQRIASVHQLGMFSVLQQLEFAESEVLAQIREHELMERERKNKKDDRDDGLIV